MEGRRVNVVRLVLAELADDPGALAELRALLAVESARSALLTPAEVSERLGVSSRTVNRWATQGRLEAVKVGRGWRFDPDRLDLAPIHRRPTGDGDRPAPQRPRRRPQAHGTADPSAVLLDLARRAA